MAASEAEKAGMITEGQRLARERRPVFKELIKDDPRLALAQAVSRVVRQALPPQILGELEKPVSKRAAVTVYQGVPAEGQPALERGQTLTHRIAQVSGEGAYNLHVYGRRAESVVNVPNAALNGVSLDREMAASESPLRVLEVGELPDLSKKLVTECPVSGKVTMGPEEASQPVTAAQAETVVETPEEIIHLCGGYHRPILETQLVYGEGATGGPVALTGVLPAPPTPAIGMLKVLYIPMTFKDQNAQLPTEAKCYEIMRNCADYYSKSSFGKLTTMTTVTPPVTVPNNEAWYIQRDSSNGGDIDGLGLEMAHAREQARRIGFDFNDYDVTVLRLIGGARSTGGWGGGGNVWVYGDSVGVTAHEIGHTFALAHANFWDTAGTSSIGPGANQEYGDSYDVMGGGGVPTDHYNAAAKVQVKWLPQNYVLNVTSSGLYRVYAFDQQVLDPRNRFAMTIMKDSQRTYWGEVRQLYNGNATRPWADKGMILGWKYPSGSGSNIQLIDTTAGSPYGKDDAAIALGQTFGDTEAGIYMTTVGVSDTTPKYVDVMVNMGDFSANAKPTLSLAASATTVPTGATVTFTATANDANGDTLAYQWQHWGDTGIRIVSPNSPVITRTFGTAGSYVVSCTVSDMKGGTVTRTKLITVGNGGSKFTISGRITLGTQGVSDVLLAANGLNPTISDADGYFTIANLTANTYTLTAALTGYDFSELFNNSITVGPNFEGANFEAAPQATVALTTLDATATENNVTDTATFRLTRTGDLSTALVVNINPATGTAVTGDYTLSPALTTGSGGFNTFTIPADETTLDVVLTTANDATAEGPETVSFLLASNSGYLVAPNQGLITMTIEDDDTTLPRISVVATTDVADEAGTSGVFTISRTGSTSAALTVNYTLSGTATSGVDYTALAGTVSIPSSASSVTVALSPLQDTLVESLETAILTLSTNAAYVIAPTAANATANLADDDTNVVSVSVSDATAQEVDLSPPGTAANTGTFLVTRTGDTTSPLTVYYSVAGAPSTGVPALNGVDFEALPGVLQIPAGSSSASVTIVPRWDGFGETPEQVLLQVGAGPTDYKLGSVTSGTVTINDSATSNAPYVEVTGTTTAVEGTTNGAFTFSLKGSIVGTVNVPFSLTGSATVTSDYTVTLPTTMPASTFDAGTGTGVLVMNSSATTANTLTLTIATVNDSALEDIENIVCTITPGAAYSLFPPTASADIWLRDNDQPTVWVDAQVGTSGSVADRASESSTGTVRRFYVSRTGSTAAALSVNYTITGNATVTSDYAITTGTNVTFDAGTQTGVVSIPIGASGTIVPVTVANDAIFEGTENITFQVDAGSYSRTTNATMYIDDDEVSSTTVSFDQTGSSDLESVTSVLVPVSLSAPAAAPASVEYIVDSGARSSTTVTNTLPQLPLWTRVVRAGSTLSSFVSTDGSTWRQVGANQTISMSTTSYTVGLVAASSTSGTTCNATIDNVSITGLDGGGASGAANFGSIGTTNPASTSSVASGVYTLNAGGTDLSQSGSTDTACYVSFPVTNSANCTITARVVSIANGNTNSRAGVEIRETTANNSRHMASTVQKGLAMRAIYRVTTNGSSSTTVTGTYRPYWVRLQRTGSSFSSWGSTDGSTWVQTGTSQVIPMSLDVQAGLAVSARSDGALTTAVFDNVTINGVAASGLTGRTIGYVNAQGADALASGVYTISASGAQIGGNEDECHFVATTLTGDFSLVARVVSQTGGATNAQAGVMARELHSFRSRSVYTGMVANAMTELVYRAGTVTNAFGTGVDFSVANGVLNFAIGEQTKSIPVTINNDAIAEPNEAITLLLRGPVGASLGTRTAYTYVINDDDSPPLLPYAGFAGSSSTVAESAGTQIVEVSLSAPAVSSATVDYSMANGTATAGSDYTTSSGTLTFAPGETVKTVDVPILDDSTAEGATAETLTITLSNPVGLVLGTQSTHTLSITDNDLPVVTIAANDSSASEAGPDAGQFTITRTGSTAAALSVGLARSGTAANTTDYASISTTQTIPIGASSVTVNVSPVNDSTNEGNETVILTVATNAAYTVGTPSSATVTIADDDRSTITITATDPNASEVGGNTGTFTLSRPNTAGGAVTVTLTVSGTATSGTDYTALAASVSFAAADLTKAVTVTPLQDVLIEGAEVVTVTISGTGFTIGGTGYDAVTIADDDVPPTVFVESPAGSGTLVASGHGVMLSAQVADDGLPSPLTIAWTQVSGPGTATFETPASASSAVTFSSDGVYVLKIAASDGQFSASDQVTIIVGNAIPASDWIAQDMNASTQQRGQSAKVGGSYVLTGMGAGYAATTTDGAHVMTRQVTGDGTIVARLTTLTGPASAPLAGVTIRDSLNRSVNRAVLGYSGGSLQFRTRTATSATDTVVTQAGITLPVWVKLERVDSTGLLTASYAADSSGSPGTWNTIGTSTITMYNSITQMGLTATGNSSTAGQLCTATLDNVALTPAPSGPALVTEDFGAAPATPSTFSLSGGTYTIGAVGGMDGSGAFYGWQYQGDVMITAKHVDATSGALSAKSGIMIRECMDNGGYAHVGRIPTGSFSGYIWRSVAQGGGGGVPSFTGKIRWMRLIREGSRITAFHAPDSSGSPGTWVQLGSPRTVVMSTPVLVGFAVDNAGGTAGVLNVAQFSGLSIVPLNKAPQLTVSAGGEFSPVSLTGTLVDDNFPTAATTLWSQISGPGALAFGDASQLETTASFVNNGTYGVRLRGDDTNLVSFRDLTFTGYTGQFAKWLETTGTGNGDQALAEADADMDGDGLVNLYEYAIGSNGTIATSNPQVVTLAPVSGSEYLRISIPKNPLATDVTFTIEATSDLANPTSWSSAGLIIETNTSTQLVVRDSVPAGPGVTRFMRVKVTRP